MKTFKLLGGCLVAVLIIVSCKKGDTINNQLNEADKNFILQAGMSNVSEIEVARVAVLKATDTVVLSFAQQMLADHTAAQNDLKTMGGVVGFTVKDTTDTALATTIAQLNTLTGRAFDSTYIHNQLVDHQTTIDFYRDELNNGNQLNVKAYANTILQNIILHHQRADSIATAFNY